MLARPSTIPNYFVPIGVSRVISLVVEFLTITLLHAKCIKNFCLFICVLTPEVDGLESIFILIPASNLGKRLRVFFVRLSENWKVHYFMCFVCAWLMVIW